jgi:hypothetical protein
MKLIRVASIWILIAVGIGSANIISLERYAIDTGRPFFNEFAISGPLPPEELPTNATYSEYAYYELFQGELYIGIVEFLSKFKLDSTGAEVVSEPYPGFVTVDNGTVSYYGRVNDTVLLIVKTDDVEGAAYTIKNLKVYPKSQENALIASTVAKSLT